MIRLFASAALAAILSLAAAPAFAAADEGSSSDDAQCAKLTSQYEFLKPFKEGLPYWKKASEEYRTGRQDCDKGNAEAGAKAMQSAISDLHVKPDTL